MGRRRRTFAKLAMTVLLTMCVGASCPNKMALYEITVMRTTEGTKVAERKRMVRYEKETIEKSPNVKRPSLA